MTGIPKAHALRNAVVSATERAFTNRWDQKEASSKANKTANVGTKEQSHSPSRPESGDLLSLRGGADRASLFKLFHSPELHQCLIPIENTARAAFSAAERARVERLGVLRWPGMRKNLSALFELDCNEIILDQYFLDRPESKLNLAFSIVISKILASLTIPRHIAALVKDEIKFVTIRTKKFMREAADGSSDQFVFACTVHCILEDLGIVKRALTKEELWARVKDAREEFDPTKLVEKNQKIPGDDDSLSTEGEKPQYRFEPSERDSGGDLLLSQQDKDFRNYKVFTREYDEIVSAADLSSQSELDLLRDKLDSYVSTMRSTIGVLANRLQRRLQLLQLRSWEFELDEGLLDPARITRVVVDPTLSPSYKLERESELGSVAVTVLLDNSASMKGEPIIIAACCADILTRALERCGIKLEVLGFTTAEWNGGRSRRLWQLRREQSPGRVSDLRHIIYKSADQPWRRCKTAFGLMLKDEILKENIDGEALAWAYRRLQSRAEKRRILVIVSDGEPADHSTLSLNHREYLINGLRQTVTRIEREKAVELLAIGIGCDLTRLYSRAIQIDNISKLGSALTSQLVRLLESVLIDSKHPI